MSPSFKVALLLICGITMLHSHAQSVEMTTVKGGTYIPLYGVDTTAVAVASFEMDVFPVTNSQFLNFVKEHPQWQRSKVKRLFSDGNYMADWEGDITLGSELAPNAPVTNISWFAATNY